MRDSIDPDIRYLTRDGEHLRVPCSRYGRSSIECARIAVHAQRAYDIAAGETSTLDQLDHMMGLVVNDHDDPAYLIREYGDSAAREVLSDALDR